LRAFHKERQTVTETPIHSVLVIGSGPIIGQTGELDFWEF
jgi:hypothetical protein